MKLPTKLIIAFLVITVLVTAQGIASVHSTQVTTANLEAIVQHTVPAIWTLDKMKATEASLIQEVFSYNVSSILLANYLHTFDFPPHLTDYGGTFHHI